VTVEHRPELVFNWRHPLIRKITAYPPGPALRNAIEALYGQALLAGHHPLRGVDTAALNRSFLALLDRAFTGQPDPAAGGSPTD
jgi:molecular chaperone HtpG